ncbi:preprotein translocase subunit YajC [Alicyclobacillus shizuokensis]|uniref:preprotein translocase subunit YajC n=1 Tax=Alicyclobacillus shizuokensis TaxID=392014 RepID=UPI0008368BF0|nr:preprotein translocase subunit YajC [Alicyclobacillus shizuokensis]
MQSSSSIIFIVVILALFYLLMFLPQRRNQRRRAEMMRNLSPGAEVMTSAGIFGTVVEVGEERVTVEIAPDVAVQVHPQAIANVVRAASDEEASESVAARDRESDEREDSSAGDD